MPLAIPGWAPCVLAPYQWSTSWPLAYGGWLVRLFTRAWMDTSSLRHRSPGDQGLECVPRPRLHVARRRGCPSVCGAFQEAERARRHRESLGAIVGLFARLFKPSKRDHGAPHNIFSGHKKGHGMNLQVGKRGTPLCFALRALATWNNSSNCKQ